MDLQVLLEDFLSHMTIVWTISILIVLLSIFLYFSIPSTDPTTDSFISMLNHMQVRQLRPFPEVRQQFSGHCKELTEDEGELSVLKNKNNRIMRQSPEICVTSSPSQESLLDANAAPGGFRFRHPPPCQTLRRILLVIAHPDDEVMFFAPTLLQLGYWAEMAKEDEPNLRFIYSLSDTSLDLHKSSSATSLLLLKRNLPLIEVQVLCFSLGAAGGDPIKREKELHASCQSMGIYKHNIFTIHDPIFSDGMNSGWSHQLIANCLTKHYSRYPFDLVISFDDKGVSYHPNHISLYFGIKEYLKTEIPVRAFALQTPSILLKYSSWLSIICFPFLSLFSDLSFINNMYQVYWLVVPTMIRHHASQMMWYRYFFLAFSSTLIYNNFKEIHYTSQKPAYL